MIDFGKRLKRCVLDFETRSMCELKKTGAYKYSLDPTTRPTALSIKLRESEKVYLLRFETVNKDWCDLPEKFRTFWLKLIKENYLFTAHNAFFERCIYVNILVARLGWPEIPVKNWRCTAAKAAACALPRSLEGAGEAMKLRIQKDRRGYSAMMKTCKPTKEWKAWHTLQVKIKEGIRMTEKSRAKAKEPEPKVFLDYDDDPQTWETLYEYCKIDTRTEDELDQALPDLIPEEQEIWHLNQLLNWRGLRIDVPTVKKIVGIIDAESSKKLEELDSLTMGLVTKPGARQSILDFLALDGIELPDIRAKTVDDRLKGFDLTEDARRLLEIRKALSLTSTRKYQSFLARAGEDDRVRDILLYHGASTGRDTGTGVQPHNFPKGVIPVDRSRPYAAVENVVECDHETLTLLYGESLPLVFSAILRNMIIPSDGYEIFVADFAKIEVAVCWWIAGNEPGLKILRAGKDPYIYMAAANTGKSYDEIETAFRNGETWAILARDLGKAQVLGAQFSMGADKFRNTAWDIHRLALSDEQAKTAITNYRKVNAAVPALWKEYEAAAVAVVESGKSVSTGWCHFSLKDKFLVIELPSGRSLRYREPQLAWRESEYGPRKTLEFWAVNSKTKKWALERTWGGVLTENIVQGTARDLIMPAMLRLEKAGYRALLTVHDEGICERPKGEGSVEDFVRILCEQPVWAPGLPVEAKGWKGPRYRK